MFRRQPQLVASKCDQLAARQRARPSRLACYYWAPHSHAMGRLQARERICTNRAGQPRTTQLRVSFIWREAAKPRPAVRALRLRLIAFSISRPPFFKSSILGRDAGLVSAKWASWGRALGLEQSVFLHRHSPGVKLLRGLFSYCGIALQGSV